MYVVLSSRSAAFASDSNAMQVRQCFSPGVYAYKAVECVFTYRELHLGSSPEIPELLWNRKKHRSWDENTDSLFFFFLPPSISVSYQSPSAAPRALWGWRVFIGYVRVRAFVCARACVCVRLLTQAEGQKHPEVERGCSILWFIFISRPYLLGVPSYSFTKTATHTQTRTCTHTHTHTHAHTHNVL